MSVRRPGCADSPVLSPISTAAADVPDTDDLLAAHRCGVRARAEQDLLGELGRVLDHVVHRPTRHRLRYERARGDVGATRLPG